MDDGYQQSTLTIVDVEYDNTLENLLCEQMNHEFRNSIVYKNIANICDAKSLIGSCHWFNKQSEEEYVHFKKFSDFILDMGLKPKINATTELEFTTEASLAELFNLTIEIEKQTMDKLKTLKFAVRDLDVVAFDFLDWFLLEQVEEIKTVTDIYNRIRMTNEVILIDNELGQR